MKNLMCVKIRVVVFSILASGFISIANAQSERQSTDAAIGFLMSGSQKLTKAEYDAFWKMMPSMNSSDKAKLISFLKPDLSDGLEYQRNLWICAKDAWVTERTPSCESAFNIFDRMIRRTKSQGISIGPMMDSYENSKRLLSAAASHGVLKGYDGKEIQLSLQLINTTINTMDIKFSRVRDALK